MCENKLKYFVALYSERKDMYYFETPIGKSRWYAKHGACKTDAYLQESECRRRGWINCNKPDGLEGDLLKSLINCRPFVAYAFDQGIQGAEEAGLEMDAVVLRATGKESAHE